MTYDRDNTRCESSANRNAGTGGVSPGRRTLSQGLSIQRRAAPHETVPAPAATTPAVTDVTDGGLPSAVLDDPFGMHLIGRHVIQRHGATGHAGESAASAIGGDAAAAHDVAARATAGSGGPLPHLDTIQQAFGPHDVTGVRAHTDGAATAGSAQLGAHAFASGNDVAFAAPAPDLHTAAHEAAHVVQQRAGVHLKDGLGQTGDAYEQHADAVADAVVRGESAAHLLGPIAGSGSPSVQRTAIQRDDAMPAQTAQATQPVTRDDLNESAFRADAMSRYRTMLELSFTAMHAAVDITCGELEQRKPKVSSLLSEMVDFAASAAIAGAAGVVAEIIAKRLAAYVPLEFDKFKTVGQRFSNDAIKEHLKHSALVGIKSKDGASHEQLRVAFRESQFKKIQASHRDFTATFPAHAGKDLNNMPSREIEALIANAAVNSGDDAIMAATSQQVAVEWSNLIARLHHGAGGWDPWAGADGSATATPTSDAEERPDFAPGAVPHASQNNVNQDSNSMRATVDNDQRPMNPDLHGILEIDLWVDGFEPDQAHFSLFRGRGPGMRLGGVSPHIRQIIAGVAQVRELKMNKVVTVFSDLNVNPPRPVGRLLITADGYVRRESFFNDDYVQRASDAAQSLSPEMLR